MSRFRSLCTTLRRRGLAGARELLRENFCATRVFHRLRCDPTRPPVTAQIECPAALTFARGSLEELRRWRAEPGRGPVLAHFFEDEAHGLDWFYLARWNGEVACIQWIATADRPTSVGDLRLCPDEVEFRNVCTLPEFRRRGIFAQMLRFALADVGANGINAVWAHVKVENRASLTALLAAGFREIERVTVHRVLGCDSIKRRPAVGVASNCKV